MKRRSLLLFLSAIVYFTVACTQSGEFTAKVDVVENATLIIKLKNILL